MADLAAVPATSGTVLARTSATEVIPGSNLADLAAGTVLPYLLPTLELGRIGLAGRSSPATLALLAGHGEIIDLTVDGAEPIDLLWLGEHPAACAVDDPRLPGLIAHLVTGGAVIGEVRSVGLRRSVRRLRDDLARAGLEIDQLLWLRPATGPVRTVVPADDIATIRFLVERGLAVAFYKVRAQHRVPPLAALERALASSMTVNRIGLRIGFVARRSSERSGEQIQAAASGSSPAASTPSEHLAPPRWLREAMAGAGLDLTGHRWALSSPGKYLSQKAIWYLVPPGATEPHLVAKVTRQAAMNERLENEVAILRQIESTDFGPTVSIPRAISIAHAGGLAIAVESVVPGQPFASRARPKLGDPALAVAVEWLTRMGAATQSAVSPSTIAEALGRSVDRCVRLYALTSAEETFLSDRVDRVAALGCPTVLMHGDPGTWNLLLTKDQHLGVLDWEAAEPDGLPLWDLFHLLRAYALLAGSRWLPHRSLKLARRHLVGGSPLTDAFASAVASYRLALGLPDGIAEPLYHLGWVQRAVKEASRLAPDRMAGGHYIRLLRAGMSAGPTPGLDRLVGRRD
jgi:aminoglycoside phosphotransferase (APT) family kinase protein